MKKLYSLIVFVSACFLAEAQTTHQSQFYSTPLLVNPAFTGNTAGPYRFAANYRSQWKNEGSPYTTFAASGDAHVLKTDNGTLGLGLTFLNDKVMDGVVVTNRLAFSTGYHIDLDESSIQKLSVGFQGSYNETRIDFTRLQFESQFGEGGFDPTAPVGEEFNNGKKGYFDLNAGAMYSFSLEDKSFFAGASMYNIMKKEESYMTEQFKSPSLVSVMAGGDVNFGFNNSFYFSGNYRKQGTSNETTLGAAWGRFIDQTGFTSFRVGMWHRVNDALIPYVGVTYKGLQVGTSFDYSVSQQKTQSQLRSTFEISVVYTADDKNQLMRLIQWY